MTRQAITYGGLTLMAANRKALIEHCVRLGLPKPHDHMIELVTVTRHETRRSSQEKQTQARIGQAGRMAQGLP